MLSFSVFVVVVALLKYSTNVISHTNSNIGLDEK